MPRTREKCLGNVMFPLKQLNGMTIEELAGTTPRALQIDEMRFPVDTWTEVDVEFVKFLLARGEHTRQMLPLCLESGSNKAFITNVPRHPDAELDGKFICVAEGVYVDTKWNAKMHVQKLWKTLEKCAISRKYGISILLQ